MNHNRRSVDEIEARLRELHGEEVKKEMNGQIARAEAQTLLWMLGHRRGENVVEPRGAPHHGITSTAGTIDVSDYVDTEDSE